ncbi:PRKCA-binding protein [Portunus trituberculatus]|uniref:PRKCA-binding protein n=1 Tax=Portunus trituberculatus TaxID=210409 RepID=A0A5B7IRZ9_PORTR|nr:PRKCA-binding protein [Portunus trituberculatus]
MTVTSGTVTLEKNDSNLIGISIGGGAKLCPCLYVVQVFDNTAAAREGTLQSGDEITGVNGVNVKGRSKQEVAQMIQRSQVRRVSAVLIPLTLFTDLSPKQMFLSLS